MTVQEAVKQSKSGGLFSRRLIAYAQEQIRADEDLICAAIVPVNCTILQGGDRTDYLYRMGNSYKIKAILCVTTKRMTFYNSFFHDDAFIIDMPFCENPRLDVGTGMDRLGVGGMKIVNEKYSCFLSGNKKLMNHLKSGIMAAMMIYQDHFAQPTPEQITE